MSSDLARRATTIVAMLALLSGSASALASVATDLEGREKWDAQRQMESRGYFMTSYHRNSDGSYQYWWSGSARNCVRIQMQNDRVRTTDTVSMSDCNQYGNNDWNSNSSSSGKSGGNDAGAAVAVGALAILGIAALASKSHHRDDKQYTDSQTLSEFERGYRDGLYHQSFSNPRSSRDYNDGYDKGVQQRGAETTYNRR